MIAKRFTGKNNIKNRNNVDANSNTMLQSKIAAQMVFNENLIEWPILLCFGNIKIMFFYVWSIRAIRCKIVIAIITKC